MENGVGLNPYNLPPWFLKTLKFLLFEVFFLIALGGSVRVMNAGLACPDWPLCFGDVIPDYHPQVYLEFIHRVLAGFIALTTCGLMVYLWRKPSVPKGLQGLGGLTILLLVSQVVMGGLTVLLQLHSKVVAAHLGLALCFYMSLLWIYLSVKGSAVREEVPRWVGRSSIALVFVIFAQVILGGLVASNYASLVCLDFPTCHGQWFPTFRGIIGLQVIHRTFADFVVLSGIVHFFVIRKQVKDQAYRKAANALAILVLVQLGVGISNVLLKVPPLIAVTHLVVATALLGLALFCAKRYLLLFPTHTVSKK